MPKFHFLFFDFDQGYFQKDHILAVFCVENLDSHCYPTAQFGGNNNFASELVDNNSKVIKGKEKKIMLFKVS
mgnify:CR=1 FL=1